jgi:hypothetical protein
MIFKILILGKFVTKLSFINILHSLTTSCNKYEYNLLFINRSRQESMVYSGGKSQRKNQLKTGGGGGNTCSTKSQLYSYSLSKRLTTPQQQRGLSSKAVEHCASWWLEAEALHDPYSTIMCLCRSGRLPGAPRPIPSCHLSPTVRDTERPVFRSSSGLSVRHSLAHNRPLLPWQYCVLFYNRIFLHCFKLINLCTIITKEHGNNFFCDSSDLCSCSLA